MFIQYRNISCSCQSSNSPAFVQFPKNPWLMQRCRDNDGSVTWRDGGWGGTTSCGRHIRMEFQLLLGGKCNMRSLFDVVKEYKELKTVL